MEQPLVSVIVPMYNAQNTIRRCVESICGQSYPNLEILLLNDGSKDDTLAVCRELAAADARIRLIDKPNSGASDTRNQGLALARGEYIQFADSDDYLLPGCTERLVSAAHGVRFPAMAFTEDQQFNAAYLHHTEGAFVSLAQPCYCYVQNPQSVCHTQVTLRAMLEHRKRMYGIYSQMCREMGLYEKYRTRLRGIYLSLFESTLPSGPVQKLADTVARTKSLR